MVFKGKKKYVQQMSKTKKKLKSLKNKKYEKGKNCRKFTKNKTGKLKKL